MNKAFAAWFVYSLLWVSFFRMAWVRPEPSNAALTVGVLLVLGILASGFLCARLASASRTQRLP
jgi:hypothetical protein